MKWLDNMPRTVWKRWRGIVDVRYVAASLVMLLITIGLCAGGLAIMLLLTS